MKAVQRRLLLALAGSCGAHLGTLAALAACVLPANYNPEIVAEVAVTTVLLRLLAGLTTNPRPVLAVRPVRKYLGQVVSGEMKFSLAFAATVYLLQWPIEKSVVFAFLGANFALQFLAFYLSRRILHYLAGRTSLRKPEHARNRIIIVGTGPRGRAVADLIFRSPELESRIDGFLDYHRTGLWRYRDIPLIGHPDRLERIIAENQVDAVVLAVEPDDMPYTAPLLATAERMGVTVSLIPDMYRPRIARAVPASLDGTPTIAYRAVPESRIAIGCKALLDKAGAVVGLLLASPIILLAAIAIKIESRGPVIFKQVRSGINGRSFDLYKFRTMCRDAEKKKSELRELNEMSGPVFKIRSDPRVTRVGRLLRKYSIDEIPQFVNVLRGDMSLVGPRPPLPSEVSRFEPWQRRKLSVKPGLTCTWQVSGRNQIDFEDWMRLDLQYIDNWSLWQDAKILARTVPTVLRGNGAA